MVMKMQEKRKCKVKILRELDGVYPEYQPEIGKVYEEEYHESRGKYAGIAVISIKQKKIIVREGEFEMVKG